MAHKLNSTTSITMMFGLVETLEERFDHLVKIKEMQSRKPAEAKILAIYSMDFSGCRCFAGKNTWCAPDEYIGTIAKSRIMLPNVKTYRLAGSPSASPWLNFA